ncbi:uncharacterized protein BP5553_08242 [Venustampulla echinocandica]|uniref:Uncharacterized protein n=1 Tax=Venustampulla echinocandica TaxID=2656787 RepID=A0A370TG44_9HELO|nr:uncharacterized protein BP5553_08242 [Venustampulla echinocandica]RDL33874.1 hypothetical protein BP5553_08242 [Venustampulla echinocandica]
MKESRRQQLALGQGVGHRAIGIENLSGHALQCGNRLFMNWSIPAAVVRFLKSKATEHVSPYAEGTPMSGVEVCTPKTAPSPKQAPSPLTNSNSNNGHSSMMLLGQDSLKLSRVHTFIGKEHMALVNRMSVQEQTVTTDWLHLWLFAFRTARTWGRGPRVWDSSNLNFERFVQGSSQNSVDTPGGPMVGSPYSQSSHQSPRQRVSQGANISNPDSKCRWSIHVCEIEYDIQNSPIASNDEVIDLGDEGGWKPWPRQQIISGFADLLKKNIESNDFSNGEITDLPINTNQIIKAMKRSPGQLLVEAFGFSIMARMVDEAFKKETRFSGEEVDICGRFDADSDCIRQLQASGSPTISQTWKHMFCHTSAQVITHCIGTLFKPHWAPDINTPSGIFLKRCGNETCGLKMQLKPLHTLVVTAVYLAELGIDGENRFAFTPTLLKALRRTILAKKIMRVDDEEAENHEDDEEESEERYYEEEHGYNLPAMCPEHLESSYQRNYFRKNKYLATLCAAVQTELVTYRRIEEGDPWISENFNLLSVLKSLETETELQIGLVSNKMMNVFCRCGIFYRSDDVVCLRVEEASAYYFSNLEDWDRTSFLSSYFDRWDEY